MATPDFIVAMRQSLGHRELWLSGATATILRDGADAAAPEVLLVRRSDNGAWTPVCGIVEPGELPSRTVVREAMEEARVRIEVVALVRLCVSGTIEYPNRDRARYLDHDFLCRWTGGRAGVGDDESTEVGWFPVGRLPELSDRHARRIEAALAWRDGDRVQMVHDPQ